MSVPAVLGEVVVKRILLVDDEQNVLDGLRNLLRSRRREWEMTFACGGESAIAELEKTPFDVVVSDMRMPRVDGAALLARVKELQPKAVRIVLSGQTDPESVMKAVFVAHRFLAKPCEPLLLMNVIERACSLNSLLSKPALREAVGKISALPPVPGTYLALCQAITRPNTSMKDLLPILQRDVGLCAKILQVVNSAFFGLPRRISSLVEAVNYLGTSTIKNLAVAVEAFHDDGWKGEISPQDLQQHCLLTAQLAQRFMGKDRIRAEEAFLSGLLHDIGWLMRVPGGTPPDLSHAVLGAYLLDLWGLPQSVVEAVAHHEQPSQLDHQGFDVVDAVHVADRIAADEAGFCVSGVLDLEYLRDRGIDEKRLDEWRAMARKLVDGSKTEAA